MPATAPLIIDRHVLQAMLLHAMQAPKTCRGTFGGSQSGHIDRIIISSNSGATIQSGGPKTAPMGFFYCSAKKLPHTDQLEKIAGETGTAIPLVCIVLALDTAGRMEAHAFILTPDGWKPVPLEMAEDHTLSQTPTNR